jgi:hypothetical protein
MKEQDCDPHEGYFSVQEIEVLILMFYTSSFTLTAKILRVSQVKVRYLYNRCLQRIEEIAMCEELNGQRRNEGMKMWEVYEIFTQVRFNLNIIKRVYRRWHKGRRPFFIV